MASSYRVSDVPTQQATSLLLQGDQDIALAMGEVAGETKVIYMYM